ncbi:MAG: sulfotransferase family 2 domain-containing protein [Marinibacterium sp.]
MTGLTRRFDCFVILAGMRTGSNFLETNLNALASVSCLGEVFNPHFVGYPNRTEMLGLTQVDRDRDPLALVGRIRAEPGLAGFRLFHDHDDRVLEALLADPHCAKIVLTRNPLDSYVSLQIARQTNQWKLTNVKRRKAALARFDAADFARHLEQGQAFQVRVLNRLQRSGQSAFYLDYEDLFSLQVLNGLAAWLGVDDRLEALDQKLKPQNPGPLRDKVENPDAVERALAELDVFNLSRTPNFEPRRGPAAPSYVAAAKAPLLFLPMPAGPDEEVQQWLAGLDGTAAGDLPTGMTQKALRQWKRRNAGHRSFTVLRHPVARAHAAFCYRILQTGPGSFLKIRETLRKTFRLPIPRDGPGPAYDIDAHRRAFMAFLDFLRANLAGQTAIRVDPVWSSQSQIVQGFGDFVSPDFIWREDEWNAAANDLARKMGYSALPAAGARKDQPFALSEIYDEAIETQIRQIYQRDYMMFGFEAWKNPPP